MDAVNLGHSVKDIPVPGIKLYLNMLINSKEKLVKNVRWAVKAFKDPMFTSKKNTYEFKSIKHPSQEPETKAFEDDLDELLKNIEFKNNSNAFQNQLKAEEEMIREETRVLVSADKTSNFYPIEKGDYVKLHEKEVNKEYKKAHHQKVKKANNIHKKIVTDLEINDRVFETTKRESFITLKDHKPNFKNQPTCRLLNPAKPEVDKISHQHLKKIVNNIRQKTNLKQWKNVYSCLDWFNKLENKKKLAFFVFDIQTFYPAISFELLEKTIEWAKQFEEIPDSVQNIIIQSRRSFLVKDGVFWAKKENPDFDVAMGGYDSAEVCDLVGLFLLSEIKKLKLNADFGLYKDDGLGASSASPKQREMIKKKLCELFKKHGLAIEVEANKKIVQYLDVELNLNDGTHRPYIKDNDIPLYVHKGSNHPPSITKNIPESINRRLSALSSNEDMFKSVSGKYQNALDNAGYSYVLHYQPVPPPSKKKRCRKRRVIWFNPPWSMNVKTNLGRKFLQLIDKHFPKGSPLHKILNRNTVKVSYRTTPNFKKIISAHNAKILHKNDKESQKSCNCGKEVCPLGGQCLAKNIIYQAKVTVNSPEPEDHYYVGLCSTTFKERLANHNQSFKKEKLRTKTALSEFIWDLKEQKPNSTYKISWRLLDRARTFSPITGVCNLCTREKYYLMFKPEMCTININDERNKPCRHKSKLLLENT